MAAGKELRQEMRRILASLDARWIEAASRELNGKLAELIDNTLECHIAHILAWIPYFPGEIDLTSFITEQLDKRAVYLPRVSPDHSMTFIAAGYDWRENMAAGFFGIPEPNQELGRVFEAAFAPASAVIVPGLSFDRHGNRLGRGGGCYDRFFSLPEMRSAVKIGVCWSLQVVPAVPCQSHDMPVDWICHERGCFKTD